MAAMDRARFIEHKGKRIVPVHPHAETVHGETGYASLSEIPFPETRAYVQKVLTARKDYRHSYARELGIRGG